MLPVQALARPARVLVRQALVLVQVARDLAVTRELAVVRRAQARAPQVLALARLARALAPQVQRLARQVRQLRVVLELGPALQARVRQVLVQVILAVAPRAQVLELDQPPALQALALPHQDRARQALAQVLLPAAAPLALALAQVLDQELVATILAAVRRLQLVNRRSIRVVRSRSRQA